MPEVITMGETMVMFSPEHSGPLRYIHKFEKRMAGAESNVAIGLGRLGHSAGWISRVGQDEFGQYLLKEIRGEGVDTSRVKTDSEHPTGIMFKEIQAGGETRVNYYRKGSAASFLSPGDLEEEYIAGARIVHITGITPALSQSCLEAVSGLLSIARKNHIPVSFDPNIRLKLWSREKAAKVLRSFLPQVDILLPGLDEARMLLDEEDIDKIIDIFLEMGIKTIAMKVGARGVWVANQKERFLVDAFPVERIADPIGAGDAFAAGFLAGLLENQSLFECGRLANAMGAFALTTYGDIEGLPVRAELDAFLEGKKGITR